MAKQFKVGDTFTHVRKCDPYRPIFYAAASGDFNPIHIDPEAGKAAGLGGPILQGLCTMAWAAEAALSYAEDPARIKRVKVRFSRPVAPGDTVTVKGEVTSVTDGLAVVQLSATNQREEDVLKAAVVELR